MTWSKLATRFEFWNEDPPPAVMLQILASWVGWKPRAATKSHSETMDTLRSMFPSGKI